jgi:hypothetical protein
MKYPKLKEIPTSRELVDVFRGYNHNLRIGDGEFYDMTNLSSDNYPILSPRPKRGIYVTSANPQGMVAKDALCYVDGGDFIINEYRVDMKLTTDDTPKTLISMGAYVIIMPDKKYINTADLSDYGNIEATVTTTDTVTFSLCKVDGAGYDNVRTQATAPEVTEEMEKDPTSIPLWVDTSEIPHQLKQYSTTTAMWSTIATTYIKISATGIGKPFSVNDGVTISGVEDESLADLNASMVIWEKGDNYIVVTGILDKVITQDTAITITRKMPNMDFIIESENRLWGCRYGVALNGEIVNEIYACKLGDFKNWNCFMGISTDSYAATVGTDGQFTGAITHLGYPLFFKENYVHKIYGNYPANYQIQTTACRGVQKGCSRSLSIVNEVLYYKARSAVCAYDGSLPVEMSSALGEMNYGNAVAGTLGNKYYISMQDANEEYHLFVYDTKKGMWHREDDTQVVDFCNCRGDLYFIDYADKQIKTVRGTGAIDTSPIKWNATTGVIGTDSPDKKYISRMDVRMSLEVGTRVSFYAEYDSSGEWEQLFTMTGTKLGSFAVPIRPQRCDHLRLKIIGNGEAKIYSICKTVEQGSDV